MVGRIARMALLGPILVVALSCGDFLGMEYVPTADVIRQELPEFILTPAEVEGVYGNYDVDCLLFTYELPKNATYSAGEFLHELEQKALLHSWNVVEAGTEALRLRRSRPAGILFSLEDTRVTVVGDQPTVWVAWVQMDTSLRVSDPDGTDEGTWAARHFWPRYERLVEEARRGSLCAE